MTVLEICFIIALICGLLRSWSQQKAIERLEQCYEGLCIKMERMTGK